MDLGKMNLVADLERHLGLTVVREREREGMVPRLDLWLAAAKGKPVLCRVECARYYRAEPDEGMAVHYGGWDVAAVENYLNPSTLRDELTALK